MSLERHTQNSFTKTPAKRPLQTPTLVKHLLLTSPVLCDKKNGKGKQTCIPKRARQLDEPGHTLT